MIGGEESDNNHKWGLQLEAGAEEYVSEVIYTLHPTFSIRIIKVTNPPFSLDRIGWGTFTIGITIVLKSGQKIETTHKLTFKENGNQVKVTQVELPQ